MSAQTREKINWWVEAFYKIGTPVALACLFWLKANFATRDEMDALQKQVSTVNTTLLLMQKDNETNARQDEILKDHETRIRMIAERGR